MFHVKHLPGTHAFLSLRKDSLEHNLADLHGQILHIEMRDIREQDDSNWDVEELCHERRKALHVSGMVGDSMPLEILYIPAQAIDAGLAVGQNGRRKDTLLSLLAEQVMGAQRAIPD